MGILVHGKVLLVWIQVFGGRRAFEFDGVKFVEVWRGSDLASFCDYFLSNFSLSLFLTVSTNGSIHNLQTQQSVKLKCQTNLTNRENGNDPGIKETTPRGYRQHRISALLEGIGREGKLNFVLILMIVSPVALPSIHEVLSASKNDYFPFMDLSSDSNHESNSYEPKLDSYEPVLENDWVSERHIPHHNDRPSGYPQLIYSPAFSRRVDLPRDFSSSRRPRETHFDPYQPEHQYLREYKAEQPPHPSLRQQSGPEVERNSCGQFSADSSICHPKPTPASTSRLRNMQQQQQQQQDLPHGWVFKEEPVFQVESTMDANTKKFKSHRWTNIVPVKSTDSPNTPSDAPPQSRRPLMTRLSFTTTLSPFPATSNSLVTSFPAKPPALPNKRTNCISTILHPDFEENCEYL